MSEGINKYGTGTARNTPAKKTMADEVKDSLRARRKDLTAQKRDTDSRMTEAQRKAVRNFEDSVKGMNTERSILIGADGRTIAQSFSGTSTHTTIPTPVGATYPDAIITHNHPTNKKMGDNLAGRVNNTLSSADMKSAIKLNARGMRVISGGGYTYSVERNGDSWGVSYDKFAKELNTLSDRYTNENFEKAYKTYVKEVEKATSRAEAKALEQRYVARANVAGQHRAMKELAKKYGWTYTHHS